MSFAAQFHMPGAYHFDYFDPPANAGPPLSAGIFRPPVSPSASSSVLHLARSTGSLPSESAPGSKAKRKRTRDDAARETTPLGEWTSMNGDSAYVAAVGAAETPLETTSTGWPRYTLAGQIETPGAVVGNPLDAAMDDSAYSDVDYRRAIGSKRRPYDTPLSPSDSPATTPSDPRLARAEPWNVLGAIGDVVVRVWEFCKTGAFQGFHAGGGTAYPLTPGGRGPSGEASTTAWCDEHDLPGLRRDPRAPGGRTPGSVPWRSNSGKAAPDPGRRPVAKRRQVSEVGDELRRNWVMVEADRRDLERREAPPRPSPGSSMRESSRSQQRPAPPSRRISIPVSRLGATPHQPRRSSARISHAGSPHLSAREPASFAQPRSPATPSRATFGTTRIPGPVPAGNPFARTASPRPGSRHGGIPSPVDEPPAGTTGHRRQHSSASSASTARRKPELGADDIEASPRLDAEAKQLATRKRVADRDADVRMEAFNTRLMEMIRQGREALRTTVRVEGGDCGEGIWEDDD